MRPFTTRAIAFALTGLGWPVLLIAISLLWPGPVIPAEYSYLDSAEVGPAQPPIDRSGSLMHLIIDYDPSSGSATVSVDGENKVPLSRIFWDIPGAAEQEAEAAQAQDASGATPQS